MTRELTDRDPVEVLGEEFLARRRRGQDPQIQQYIDTHPEYAEQISALFPAMIAMEDLKKVKNESSDRPIRLHVDRLERLGDYRIIREIGHGGMGIVYEAEQQSLHRRVAVKVFPKQAIGDSKQLQRFQREAKTAGGLHHTNIVPVFGVGEQDGMHYFVMQLLEGVGLDEVIAGLARLDPDIPCDDCIDYVVRDLLAAKHSRLARSKNETEVGRNLEASSVVEVDERNVVAEQHSTSSSNDPHRPNRLANRFGKDHWRRIADMGAQVAQALQYAHGKGVMHRDIKPSNLMVGADSRVWITDFGLAVTHDQDRLSRSGDVVGTLRYMSPEQLNGRSDQRSDVYGLGLTLYELMTMRPAFEGESRGSLIRKVSASSPPSPRSLCRDIPKDLETIILKAIARSASSRYRTAAEFAEDLRRFRDDEPIRARRIGPVERLSRWSRRNPAVAGMSLALVLGAAISFAAISWNWRKAIQEKQNAIAQGVRAENNLSLALNSMDRLLERFESDWMSHPVEPEEGEREPETQVRFIVSDHSAAILKEALEFYDQFAKQNAGSPELQRDTAKAYRRAGDILERLGRYNDAEQAYRRSAETLSRQLESASNDTAIVAETAAVLNRLAMVLYRTYQYEQAFEELEFARRLLTRELTKDTSSRDCTYELALANTNLGLVLWRMQKAEESTQRHRRAILLLEGLAEENPLEAKYRLALARAYRYYYPIAEDCQEQIYANEIRESAAAILEQLVADFPSVPDYRCELSEMLTKFRTRRRVDRAVQLAEQLNQEFQSIPRYQTALARSLTVQANLVRESDPEQAFQIHRRATDLLRRLCVQFPEIAAYRAFRSGALRETGVTLRKLNRFDEAVSVLEEAVAEQTAYLGLRPESRFGRRLMAFQLRTLAETLEQSGRPDEAAAASASADEFWRRRPPMEDS